MTQDPLLSLKVLHHPACIWSETCTLKMKTPIQLWCFGLHVTHARHCHTLSCSRGFVGIEKITLIYHVMRYGFKSFMIYIIDNITTKKKSTIIYKTTIFTWFGKMPTSMERSFLYYLRKVKDVQNSHLEPKPLTILHHFLSLLSTMWKPLFLSIWEIF